MPCNTCKDFAFGSSGFEELGATGNGGTRYRCKECGAIVEVFEEHTIHSTNLGVFTQTSVQNFSSEVPQPFLLVACLRALARPLFRTSGPAWDIDWKDTLLTVFARTLMGLLVGSAIAFLLIPVVLWPGRRARPSLYESLGKPDWIAWVFIVPILIAILCYIATARATVRHANTFGVPEHFREL